MIIEETIRDYINNNLDCPVWFEIPKGENVPEEFVLIEKTGTERSNHINYATIALQSYAGSMLGAMELNDAVKGIMDSIIELDRISSSRLNSDYNYTDTRTKGYRYQAVYNITHY